MGLANYISKQLPSTDAVYRWHVSGDFLNQTYFDAFCLLGYKHRDCLFYAYTKALPYWANRLGEIPDNVLLTASKGGTKDDLIAVHGLRFAEVVGTEAEAEVLGLPVDHDDTHACDPLTSDQSFALLVHGTQPKGSLMGKAAWLNRGAYSHD
jgi:hypothetical protein